MTQASFSNWNHPPMCWYPKLERMISVRSFVCMSRSGYPPWILKRGGLESSGRRLISSIGKTKRIAFFYFFFWRKNIFSKFSDFLKKSDFFGFFEIFSDFRIFLPFFTIFGFLFFLWILGFFLDFLDFLAEDRSPPQELEVGPRSGPHLLVLIKAQFTFPSTVHSTW